MTVDRHDMESSVQFRSLFVMTIEPNDYGKNILSFFNLSVIWLLPP